MSKANIYVVIPAYNEGKTIGAVVNSVLPHTNNIIVVDDGSNDDTAAQVADLNITLLQNPSNQGKAASLMKGFQHALAQGAEAVITLDGDAQHNPDDIPKLISAFNQYPQHLIIAARLANNAEAPAHRLFANRFADFWVSWAAGHFVQDSQSGFRLYPATLLKTVCAAHNKYSGFVFESEIIINAAHKKFLTHPVTIASCYPEQRRLSHYRPWKDVTKTVLMISGKIIKRGFNIPGLVRSLKQARQ